MKGWVVSKTSGSTEPTFSNRLRVVCLSRPTLTCSYLLAETRILVTRLLFSKDLPLFPSSIAGPVPLIQSRHWWIADLWEMVSLIKLFTGIWCASADLNANWSLIFVLWSKLILFPVHQTRLERGQDQNFQASILVGYQIFSLVLNFTKP